MCTHKLKRGFTLIEVLVVIGIIAILAGVVLVAINPNRQFQQARDSQRTSNTAAILNAIGQYTVDHKGELPAGISSSSPKQNISNTGADICKDLVPTYLPALPTDPGSTHKGAGLSETACTGTYDTNYALKEDTNGRITITAEAETPGADPISITR